MAIYKGQWEDNKTGNVLYPHTSTDVVFNSAGKNVDALLNEKSNSNHTHDDRYYTETEMNSKLNAKLDTTGNGSNVTNTFTQAATRTNLTTGEKLSISLGKIMKWFSDLKTVAFSGSYNDLTNKPTSLKNPTSMKVQLNGGTTEGTNQYTYDGSAAKNINITPSSIGAAASSHTHNANQITGLTASRALVSDSSGKPAVSAVTSTELGYLDGVTSNIQTQLNGKSKVTDALGNPLKEVPMTPPQNELVNGDFQINQRQQTSYNFNSNGKYGMDCWKHRQGNYYGAIVVEPLDGGGIKTTLNAQTGAGIRQYVKKDSSVIGEKRTVLINIDNVEYTGTVTLSTSVQSAIENDKFKLEVYYDNTTQSIVYSLWYYRDTETYPTSEVHYIRYAHMWPGSIAYPHVKEDYATALMRCQEYVFVTVQKKLVGKVGTGHLEGFNFPIKMKSTPLYTVVAFEATNGVDKKSELKSISCTNRGVVYMTLQSPTQQEYQYTILFSCEPL